MIEFDQQTFDFGTVNEGDIVDAEFTVTNVGETDLIITKATPSCGCTVPIWPRQPIKPGESSKIIAKFNTKRKSLTNSLNLLRSPPIPQGERSFKNYW